MKYFLFFLFIVISSCVNGAIIQSIYFDPSTSITVDGRDGVVVLELTNGTKSTMCMTNVYDSNNAQVICNMMGYTGGNNKSVAVISAKVSTIGNTYFQNVSCVGTESTLESCSNFVMSNTSFLCNNHNQDLHVYCYGTYTFDQTTMDISTCNGTITGGLLSVSSAGITAFFCGVNLNFGLSEARYFCEKTLCANSTYASILVGNQSPVRFIGGFNNMSCSATGCTNLYPYQSNRCTPDTNIGVLCANNPTPTYIAPTVLCRNSSMTVSWNATVFNSTVANNFFAVQNPNGTNCTYVSVGSTVTQTVNLTVPFDTCGMMITGDADNITFTFEVIRMFPKVNNVVIYPDQNFNVSCVISRNFTVTQGPLIVNPVALPPNSGNTNVANTITLYSDSGLNNAITNLGAVTVGSTIYASVELVNPPPNVILVLNQCYYGQPSINLIFNRCPVSNTVQISVRTAIWKSFSFVVTQNLGSSQSTVTCITSICSTMETSCLSSC